MDEWLCEYKTTWSHCPLCASLLGLDLTSLDKWTSVSIMSLCGDISEAEGHRGKNTG